ncbi:hypothetical protein [Solicola gregarius]|uniref:Uncharacterized protein n=1 Tax=Solicola gregarius TaxID=2908642 RepID=A0AA46TJN5_9ACTN|nr:hypothetical protein [Solicola gregarius]UYM06077.1 hypothetical protein L0C25_03110 [Solicola gregarius]
MGELGGEELELLQDHAGGQLNALLDVAETDDPHLVVMWLGLRGVSAVPYWWGTPKWPFVVDEFFRRLDKPDHPHWLAGTHPGPPPESAGDRETFRDLLLFSPDALPTEVVQFCIHDGGMGFIHDVG